MADLANDSGVIRLRVDPVSREDGGRVLASAALEYRDARDGEWWPIVRLPVVHLVPGGAESLVAAFQDLMQGVVPGFAWQSGDGSLGLQIGVPEGQGELLVAEVGMDLALFLAESAGAPRREGAEAALFRWPVTRGAAVAFADALRRESGSLGRDG
ncbi:MAG: hypothetical protein NTY18_02060 [Deltaproteobacteria bacterium]|jgi:hypothetical protein|nr:hypothetical protein [Deltaproteobacteria bacterium]